MEEHVKIGIERDLPRSDLLRSSPSKIRFYRCWVSLWITMDSVSDWRVSIDSMSSTTSSGATANASADSIETIFCEWCLRLSFPLSWVLSPRRSMIVDWRDSVLPFSSSQSDKSDSQECRSQSDESVLFESEWWSRRSSSSHSFDRSQDSVSSRTRSSENIRTVGSVRSELWPTISSGDWQISFSQRDDQTRVAQSEHFTRTLSTWLTSIDVLGIFSICRIIRRTKWRRKWSNFSIRGQKHCPVKWKSTKPIRCWNVSQ